MNCFVSTVVSYRILHGIKTRRFHITNTKVTHKIPFDYKKYVNYELDIHFANSVNLRPSTWRPER